MTRSLSDFVIGALVALAVCLPSDSWATTSLSVVQIEMTAPTGTYTRDKAHPDRSQVADEKE
jgi:hypothetical protein